MTAVALPQAYTLRRPTLDDADAIVELVRAAEIAEHGETDFERDFLLEEWDEANLETDAWAVIDGEGRIIGYGDVTERARVQFHSWAVTHPDHTGRGIASSLLDLIEARAAERVAEAPEGTRVTLNNWVAHVNRAAREILERRGYRPVRHYWRMTIQLDGEPAPPEWPAGIGVRTCVPGRDERATFDALEESFSDHWGHVPDEFDRWVKQTQRENHDPSLWFLAVDESSGEIAGLALCSDPQLMPWVDKLAVRRPWRRRGLGLALLQHAFGELWRRGRRRVALGVDSQNLTGATRLYERAGMTIDRQWDRYEKELRPGRELATTSV